MVLAVKKMLSLKDWTRAEKRVMRAKNRLIREICKFLGKKEKHSSLSLARVERKRKSRLG